ncbi:MAG: hypothetical protein A4E71_02535 [Smithella sp. PtaU1.Bin162]|nr:MAG: hypothetical protein A4E71_02535 [Smithella sp. PtaU1.Bin162]
MDQIQITRQIMEFNKAIVDNTFKSMALLQDQTEKLVFRFMEKVPWIPNEGKKAMNKWVNFYKKGIEDFKSCTDENYNKAMDYFSRDQTQEEYKDKKKS